jgi:2-haloacid dehalogenase
VLVFDIAETLLDLQTLRPFFQRVFGKAAMVEDWFGETILYSETLTNTFVPFTQLGGGVLRMLGRIHNVVIGQTEVAELGKGLAALAPHPDVPDSLKRLKAAGYRLVTLTDSPANPGQGPLQDRSSHAWRNGLASSISPVWRPVRCRNGCTGDCARRAFP